MSQIAVGYVVPSAAMEQAASCCARGDQRGMRAALAPHAFEHFAWSGYVIVILNEWLRERAVDLPVSDEAVVRRLVETHAPMLCAPGADATAFALRLDALNPSSEELARYWTEFTGENVPEAPQFMTDAFGWLTRLAHAGADADWCVLFEG
jgi:hypothetical protein